METIGRRLGRDGYGAVWVVVAAAIMVGMLTCAAGRDPVLHKIGGGRGWTHGLNYTEWAAAEPQFYVGDWLYFVFDKHYFNVLEVNKTSYENCIDRDFIKNITKGGRDVFNLTDAKPYYFLSSGGYCYHGMKLAINVQEFVPTPAASPSQNGAPPNTGTWMVMPLLLLTLVSAMILFNTQ